MVLGRGPRRLLALFALGVVLGFLVVLAAYLNAPRNYSQANGCSEYEDYLGRW